MTPTKRYLLLALILVSSIGFAQSDRGKIIKAGSSILDPNGDGFVSKTNQGFGFDGYYVDEFEITMFGIPKLGGDVTGDNVGNLCGITDLTPDNKGYSVYAVRDNNNNLIFRFRVGDDNPSVEAWTILLDTDGLFGANDQNSTPENPGFEIDITLIKNANKGILVYNIDGIESCPTPLLSYPFSTHFQISIADEVTCGDPDYFYDYYVPFSEIATAFGIDVNTGLRYAAVSNVSATCAMAGKIADVSGVDNNDPEYENCVPCAFTDLVSNQCPTPVIDLCETCPGFSNALVDAPTIDTPVRAGQPEISGTAEPGVYIVVEIYSRIGGTDLAPVWDTAWRERKTTNAQTDSTWVVTLSSPLQSYDKVVARAQIDEFSTPCGADGDNSASASVTVVEPNDKPSAIDQPIVTNEDTEVGIVLSGNDPDGDNLIFSIVTGPTHGIVAGTPPNVTYTPNPDYNGPDGFTFQVSDGIYYADVAGTISITVLPVNDRPVANNQNVTATEDLAKAITLTGSDVDGDVLTYTVQTQPSHGALSGTPPNLTYTPISNFNGNDSFTFLVSDGVLNSSVATVAIIVEPTNDGPTADDQTINTPEDVSIDIILTANDIDADALIYSIVAAPLHGTLLGAGSNYTYTPAFNYAGGDSFTFKVNDGTTDSNSATITINVTAVNDPPKANDQSVTTNEDVAKAITLSGSDIEGGALSYTIQNPPAHGTLTGTLPNQTYTPDQDYQGPDSFTFTANDGAATSTPATVSITITAVGDGPHVNDQNVTTPEDVQAAITLTGSDPDGDALTFSIVSNPANGILIGTAPNLTYRPNLNYSGTDNFTFKATDGTSDSNVGVVSIVITASNDAPIAFNQNAAYQLNTPKSITLTAIDPDGNPLTYSVVSGPSNGALTGSGPNLIYTPDTGFTGIDNFTFKVNDGFIDSENATVTLSLADVANSIPVAVNQDVTVAEDEPKAIQLIANDLDGDILTFTTTQPTHGTISGSGSLVNYQPAPNYNGPDNFTFRVNDGITDSNLATVTITVTQVNDKPVANPQSVLVIEDVAKFITLTGNDVDGDVLTYGIVNAPTHGILTGTGPNLTYTPASNYFGQDSFEFEISDGTSTAIATVSINVTSVDDPPVATNDQTATTDEDNAVTITILTNDADPDGTINPNSIDLDPSTPLEDKTIVTGSGTYTVTSPGQVLFTPALNYFGNTPPVKYTVKDNSGNLSNEATITILVNPINDAPVPQDAVVVINEDETSQICVTVIDVENDPAVISDITVVDGHGLVTLINQNGTLCFSYQPDSQFNGQDKVLVTTCDANNPALCNTATISLTIAPVNDAPSIIVNGLPTDELSFNTQEDVPVNFCFEAVDIDGDITQLKTFNSVSASGTLIIQPSGLNNKFCLRFEPAPDFNGLSIWNLSICDAGNLCSDLAIKINVTPVNDAPVATDQTLDVTEDTPKNLILAATDVDGDVLAYEIVFGPVNGTLTGTGSNLIYTPKSNYFGKDSLKFTASDGTLESNVAMVKINVAAVNDAPVITSLTLEAKEDSVLQVCLNVIDVEGDVVTYEQPVNLSGGGTMITDSNLNFCFVFSPDTNYNGLSLWQMKVCDDSGACGTSTTSITVLPVNDPPVAVNDEAEVLGAISTMLDALSNDLVIADPYQEFYDIFMERDSVDELQLIRVKAFNGSATISDSEIQYTPKFEFQGRDSVQYWIQDSGGLMDSATVHITVGPAKFRAFQAVSPNGDELNDYWRINGIDQDPGNTVKIFDRFNNLVFETSNYDNERNHWSGQANHGLMKGNLPEGTYYYTIEIDLTEDDQGRRLFSGYIILKRN